MLSIPVVLIARATLGTINHTCLTVRVLEQEGIEILGIIFNGYQEMGVVEETNPRSSKKSLDERYSELFPGLAAYRSTLRGWAGASIYLRIT